MAKINNLFYLSQYKRQKKKNPKPHSTCTVNPARNAAFKLSRLQSKSCKMLRTTPCHFLHLHFFIAISRRWVNLPTKHLFHDSTRTPDFPAFFILMWLTHHFLSTSTVKASVVRTLMSHCYGKRKGKARKGLRETLVPSRRSPRGPFGREGRSADLTWSAPHIPRAPSHTSSPEQVQRGTAF